MKRRFLILLYAALIPFACAAPERWAKDIAAFAQADRAHPPAPHGIVFVGSSSIAKWKTLATDFPGLPMINRGFGGSEIGDAVFYADQIVIAYAPRIVVLYSGDNDLAAGKSPESVEEKFRAFVAKVHAALPQTRIVFIAMKPSPSRWGLRAKYVAGNRMIAADCARDPRLSFVDVWPVMLGADGQPRPDIFLADRLHMNHRGYELWIKLLNPLLR